MLVVLIALAQEAGCGLEAWSDEEVERALDALAATGTPEAVDAVAGMLACARGPSTYWRIVDAAASFSDPAALRRLDEFFTLNAGKPYARDIDYAREDRRRQAPLIPPRDPTGTALDVLPFGTVERLRKGAFVVLVSDCPMKANPDAHQDEDHDVGHIQSLLKLFGLPYEVVLKSEFESFDLTGRTALLVNANAWRELHHGASCRGGGCGLRLRACAGDGPHLVSGNRLSDAAIGKIRTFIEHDGGYLFTQDSGLAEILERAWPDLVRAGEYLKGIDAPVTPAVGAGSQEIVRRVFSGGTRRVWKIPEDTASIRIVDPARVGALIVSEAIGGLSSPRDDDDAAILECGTCGVKTRAPSSSAHPGCGGTWTPWVPPPKPRAPAAGDDAAAATFAAGDGRVMHVLARFGSQNSQEDEFALQTLLLNYLIEATGRNPDKQRR